MKKLIHKYLKEKGLVPKSLYKIKPQELLHDFWGWMGDLQDNGDKWDGIPGKCIYKGKKYRILSIDMQGGYFTLYDTDAKKGEKCVFENINMEDCSPTNEED